MRYSTDITLFLAPICLDYLEIIDLLNNRQIGLSSIIGSIIIGIIALGLDVLPEYMIFPLLIISGIGLILGIVLLNYKAKHSKRDKSKFKRTNTKSWDT